jgi:fructokinase
MSTTLAFVSLDENGDREFAFNRGADEHLSLSDKVIESLTTNSILHLGSATALLGGLLSNSYYKIAQAAKQKGNLICFDPNFRVDLWKNREVEFTEACQPYIKIADIIKVSDEELILFSQQQDIHKGCEYFHNLGVKVVLVTLGSDGCLISQNRQQTIVPAYKINVVDTTGAGDSFIGAILFRIAKSAASINFNDQQLIEHIAFAGKVSGLVCSKIGAMSALPSLTEVDSMTFIINE